MEQSRREQMITLLQEQPWSLHSLALFLGVHVKLVEDDLNHISRSTGRSLKLKQIPPVCQACGYVFQKRTRYSKPSRCPQCRSEHVLEGTFQLVEK